MSDRLSPPLLRGTSLKNMKTFKDKVSFIDESNHRAVIDVEITDRNGYFELSMSGEYCGSFGQCLDSIKPRTVAQTHLIRLWEKYHLTNVSALPGLYDDLLETIKSIKEESAKYEKELALELAEKTEDEKLLKKMEEYGISEDNLEACRAYLEAMEAEDLSNFEESYCGQFDSDEDFAHTMAEDTADMPKDSHWPMYCIDWEWAARELMNDYSEQDGFYFRNL